ncbi:unnamed protein product [Mycena citricolor]|uniref:WD40 repeat-like protein n=1 Tax=Mycena citricolor TaxID=2018698 RepID=A0AAD2K7T6_9AGAR|nr:unnamed protein product [Mycena citricolor]
MLPGTTILQGFHVAGNEQGGKENLHGYFCSPVLVYPGNYSEQLVDKTVEHDENNSVQFETGRESASDLLEADCDVTVLRHRDHQWLAMDFDSLHELSTGSPATTRTTRLRRSTHLAPNPTFHGAQLPRKHAATALLSRGFPYSRRLTAHDSCVNALAFSSQNGRFLASGGDDLSIHLWDLHSETVKKRPSCTFRGPVRNIFVLAFSAHNRFIFSGGVDETVLKFDAAAHLERGLDSQVFHTPDARFYDHEDSIRAISPHVVQDEVFLTASEDGKILMHDGRARIRAQDTLQLDAEVTSVQFHPMMEHIFLSSDSRGRLTELTAVSSIIPTFVVAPLPPWLVWKQAVLYSTVMALNSVLPTSAYIWALPPSHELTERRRVMSYRDWTAEEHTGVTDDIHGPRYVPVELDTPLARLGGHHSIVNTVIVHPEMLVAATSGVEAHVVLHGAAESLLGGLSRTSQNTRAIGSSWEWASAAGEDERDGHWVEEQQDTVQMFDSIIYRERAIEHMLGSDGEDSDVDVAEDS